MDVIFLSMFAAYVQTMEIHTVYMLTSSEWWFMFVFIW